MCKRLIFLVLLTLVLAGTVSAQFQPWIQEDPAAQTGRLVTPPPGGFFQPSPQTQRFQEFQQQMRERWPASSGGVHSQRTCTQTCGRDGSGQVTCRTTCY
jgi:hypothetical protein